MNVQNGNLKKVRFLPSTSKQAEEAEREPELNFDKSSLSSVSSKSSGGYEEPYDPIGPYKKFRRQNNFKKIKMCFTLPAKLLAFVSNIFIFILYSIVRIIFFPVASSILYFV
jgi:hypothetical protein